MKSKIITIILIISTITLIGCERNDVTLIRSFLEEYYSQYELSSDEWSQLYADYLNPEKENSDEYGEHKSKDMSFKLPEEVVAKFSNYLTPNCINNLIKNYKLIDFTIENKNIQDFKLSIVDIEKVSNKEYEATYQISFLENEKPVTLDKKIVFVISNESDLIDFIKGKL